MEKASPTQVLTDAKARDIPWRLIVEALRELTAAGSLDAQERPWLEVAASLSGYSTTQLRQAQRTYTAIESFIGTQDLPVHALDWPMSNLDVISRIAKVAPEKAEKLLISSSQKSWRDLCKLYESLRDEPGTRISPMSAGHRSARSFTSALSHALSEEKNLKYLLGDKRSTSGQSMKPWPGRYMFAHPDFVVGFQEAGISRLAAFEGLRFYGEISLQAAANAAVKAAAEATFFARYYWCIASRAPAENLQTMRNNLSLMNVGIVLVENGTINILLEPTGEPIPNRQYMIFEDTNIRRRLGNIL
jgi:hypothetical protein